MKKLVLFGNTDFTKRMKYYVEHDAHRKVEFVVVDREYIQSDTFEGVPVLSFEEFVGEGKEMSRGSTRLKSTRCSLPSAIAG